MLKKKPIIKNLDDFINSTPDLIANEVAESQEEENVTEEEKEVILDEEKTEIETSAEPEDDNKRSSVIEKQIKKTMFDQDMEDLKRITTYIKSHLLDKMKIIAVLNHKKEYELWNEAINDLISKYTEEK